MPQHSTTPGHSSKKLTKAHKFSIAGFATLGAAALAISLVPGNNSGAEAQDVAAAPVAYVAGGQVKDVHAAVTDQLAVADQKAQAATAKLKAQAAEAAKPAAATAVNAQTAAKAQTAATQSRVVQAVSRSAVRTAPAYTNNLDGWIRQSLDIMRAHKIPGSYNGLYRNIMRESSGNPMAINNWDINAINGVPSKGLLQVIQPTFNTYHVAGTSWNIYDPVANITAAANYAAHRYGTIDNVNSAY
ncbi:transglycosylase SLT domain-containing protein [Streptomyces sp. NPDC002004]